MKDRNKRKIFNFDNLNVYAQKVIKGKTNADLWKKAEITTRKLPNKKESVLPMDIDLIKKDNPQKPIDIAKETLA